MFVLHVDMKLKPGSQQALEKTYIEIFQPAISQQNGFSSVSLLCPIDDGGAGDYRLSIAFADRASQQKWVATDLHQKVWPQMEGQCANYTVKNYNAV